WSSVRYGQQRPEGRGSHRPEKARSPPPGLLGRSRFRDPPRRSGSSLGESKDLPEACPEKESPSQRLKRYATTNPAERSCAPLRLDRFLLNHHFQMRGHVLM